MLFSIPVSLFRQDNNPLEERNATPIFINGSLETFTTVLKFNNYLQISDTIRDTTNQLLLPNEALENNTSIIYNTSLKTMLNN